jgi:ATP-dependent exoDNAse (exonuclease V) alpha subunit
MTQDEALALLKTGASIFLTGQPGSGKTHTVNRYLRDLAQAGVDVAYTASTGIAATHGHGVTIHAWSGIGVREALMRRDLDVLASNRRLAARIEKTSVLIIDEVSMLPPRALTLADTVCRHIRATNAPFGGMQVVLVGDFFQLPPVIRRRFDSSALPLAEEDADSSSAFAHASAAWRDLDPMVCYLSEQHRQDDQPFLDILDAIRSNACTGIHRERLAARMVDRDQLPPSRTRLFTHNAAVDEINQQQLAKLDGETHTFAMTAKGAKPSIDALKRGCLSPDEFAVKKNAVVMFTKNDPAGRYVNGTLGTVEDFDSETGSPIVRTRSGKRIFAEPVTWKIEENGKERASVTQIPLRLAWAITVHKSQGMSLDAAVIDLSRAFEYGQGYVALSRLRSLSGLHLLGLNERALLVHPAAIDTDAEFRRASHDALQVLERLGPDELAQRHAAFLEDCGASGTEAAPKSYDMASLRKAHGKAYAPWTETEEQDLRRRHQAGESVGAIAERLGRKPGAIRSRLKKLALIP